MIWKENWLSREMFLVFLFLKSRLIRKSFLNKHKLSRSEVVKRAPVINNWPWKVIGRSRNMSSSHSPRRTGRTPKFATQLAFALYVCNFTYKPCKLHFGLRMKFFIYFVKFILLNQLHFHHKWNIYLRLSLTIYWDLIRGLKPVNSFNVKITCFWLLHHGLSSE